MSNELILEIGTEEIPALFLEESTRSFRENIEKRFNENTLVFGCVNVLYTPRRISVRITDLMPEQQDRIIETFGPPKSIAFDENENPTKAAEGFARSQGVDVGELSVTKRDKGEFLSYRKKLKGDKTKNVLESLLPELIRSIPFRKSMRWGKDKVTFARPIRWIMCIYNNEIIGFRIENVTSSNISYGHRFISNNSFKPGSWDEYVNGLRERCVILDQHERKEIIIKESAKVSGQLGGYIEDDHELVDTVTNLVEYPVVLHGSFEQKFTNLPDEVLTSVMKNHQKYFPVHSNDSGELTSYFIFVCGSPVKDTDVVVRGNERVLKARLNDAEFFYLEDIKRPLIEKLDELKDMVFLSGIGSFYDKSERLVSISRMFSELCGKDKKFVNDISRAAKLCKIDLVSQMVFEFPELQGIMGKYYAISSKEKKSVASAIEEHYMPTARDSSIPRSQLGALLSITDKIDNISCCFAAGLKPTGSADPYALRRQAIGILQITLEKKLDYNLGELISHCLEQLNPEHDGKSCCDDILNFFIERFRNLLIEKGYSNNVIDSVLSTGFMNILDCYNRIRALETFRKQKDFEELAVAFKRVVNIAKEDSGVELNTNLFSHSSENDLYQKYISIKQDISGYLRSDKKNPGMKDYLNALNSIKTLKTPVDNFFDSVMVMDKNEDLRNNRMALLNGIKEMFFQISDFSRI